MDACSGEVSVITSPYPALTLRPYQREALTAIEAASLRGVRPQVVSMPTGTGKMVVFAHLAAHSNTRTLILAHRDELIRQTVGKLAMVSDASGIPLDIGIVKAERDEHTARVVVASVQTLQSERRLQRLAQNFALVVVDECHHAEPENAYGRILNYVGATLPDGPLIVGFSATPYRPNNAPIVTTDDRPGCFAEVVYTLPLMEMIAKGYLSPVIAKEVMLRDLSMKDVRTAHGDYVERDLEAAMLKANAPLHVSRVLQECAQGRRSLVFCPTVAMVHAVANECHKDGLRVADVLGEAPTDAKQAIYAALREGQLDAIISYGVLTEGFDEPSIDCIVLARPTKSRVLFAQCVGRGLRLYPGKENCLLIDACCVLERHDLFSLAAQLGLLKTTEEDERPKTSKPRIATDDDEDERPSLRGIRIFDHDLLDKPALHWIRTAKRGLLVAKIKDHYLRIVPTGKNHYKLEHRHQHDRRYVVLAQALSLEYCMGIASDTANEAGVIGMAVEGARWRNRPPKPISEKRASFLRKLNIAVNPNWTAGELDDAMTAKIGDWY